MFSLLREYFRITLVATEAGPVVGNGGPASFAELGFDDAGSFDILLVPGGMGTHASVTDARLIAWLGGAAGSGGICADSLHRQRAVGQNRVSGPAEGDDKQGGV